MMRPLKDKLTKPLRRVTMNKLDSEEQSEGVLSTYVKTLALIRLFPCLSVLHGLLFTISVTA